MPRSLHPPHPHQNSQNAKITCSDPNSSIWVSANAGAGKTTILTVRFIRLLLNGVKPSSILCITFTQLATSEMKQRIINQLERWSFIGEEELRKEIAEMEPTPPDAKKLKIARNLYRNIMENLGDLNIKTLHSFATGLLKTFPIEAGIAPHFEVMDEQKQQELCQQSMKMLFTTRFEKLKDCITILARYFASELSFFDLCQDIIKNQSKLWGNLDLSQNHTTITQASTPLNLRDYQNFLQQFHDASLTEETYQKKTSCLARTIGFLQNQQNEQAFTEICELLITKDKTKGKAIRSIAKKSVLNKISATASEQIITLQNLLLQELEIRKEKYEAEINQAFRLFACELLKIYQSLKGAKSLLDYDEIITTANKLLNDDKHGHSLWVLYKLDYQISHIMLDEAQDTSKEQWGIIKALTTEFFSGSGSEIGGSKLPRTIFIVGDEKQSIYSFQDADIEEYQKMKGYFQEKITSAGQNFKIIPLEKSYRSVPHILQFVDEVFNQKELINNITDANMIRHIPHRADVGIVEKWPIIEQMKTGRGTSKKIADSEEAPISQAIKQKPTEESAEQSTGESAEELSQEPSEKILAEKIALKIRNMLDNKITLPSVSRACEAGDFMVLVKNRNGDFIRHLTGQFHKYNIPCFGSDRIKLNEEIVIEDFLSLTEFLLLPYGNNLALAEVLKSSFFRLTDQDLLFLTKTEESLWQALQNNASQTTNEVNICKASNNNEVAPSNYEDYGYYGYYSDCEDDNHHSDHLNEDTSDRAIKYGKIVSILKKILARADFMTISEIFCYITQELGFRAKLIAEFGTKINQVIDEFLHHCHKFEQENTPSLQLFTGWILNKTSQIKKSHNQTDNMVRILTCHSAKGLQAPVVFMIDNFSKTQEHKNKILFSKDARPRMFLKKPQRTKTFTEILETQGKKAKAEEDRLLYVGLTRAEDMLILCGCKKQQSGAGFFMDKIKNINITAESPLESPLESLLESPLKTTAGNSAQHARSNIASESVNKSCNEHATNTPIRLINTESEEEEAQAILENISGFLATNHAGNVLIIINNPYLLPFLEGKLRSAKLDYNSASGVALLKTTDVIFLNIIAEYLLEDFSAHHLLALLKHPFCMLNLTRQQIIEYTNLLETKYLRGVNSHINLQDLIAKITEQPVQAMLQNLQTITATACFTSTSSQKSHRGRNHSEHSKHSEPNQRNQHKEDREGKQDFAHHLKIHLTMAQNIADGSGFMRGEKTLEIKQELGKILQTGKANFAVNFSQYHEYFKALLHGKYYKPKYNIDANIQIIPASEAKMMSNHFDFVVFSGANEEALLGQQKNLWLNEEMKKRLNFICHKTQKNIKYFDFYSIIFHKNLVITNVKKQQNNLVSELSFLTIFKTLLQINGLNTQILSQENYLRTKDEKSNPSGIKQATPPPKLQWNLATAPLYRKNFVLSASAINLLVRNPYGFFAKYILKLKPLEAIAKTPSALEFGTELHNIMEKFCQIFPQKILDFSQAEAELQKLIETATAQVEHQPIAKIFWQTQFAEIKDNILKYESQRQEDLQYIHTEQTGEANLAIATLGRSFKITARADRIEQAPNHFKITDYKRKTTPKFTEDFQETQVLTAILILVKNGFAKITIPPPTNQQAASDMQEIQLEGEYTSFLTEVKQEICQNINIKTYEEFLITLLTKYYQDEAIFTANTKEMQQSDYAKLSRFKEI